MSLSLLLFATSLLAADTGSQAVIGAQKQLFLDDTLIASNQNVTRTIHPAVKYPGNPVLWPTEPWEGATAIVYGSVVRDGDTFRMWYHSDQGVSYAESKDGIAWSKPALGLFKVDGHDTNVIVSREATEGEPNVFPYFYEVFGVHADPRADASKRYVMGFLSIQKDYDGPRKDPFHGNQRRGLAVATSPDGIRWTLADSFATDAICDGATHWMWDPARERYVLYGRTKYVSPEVEQACAQDAWAREHFWGRSVARVESPDFLNWDFKDPASAPVVMTVDTQDRPGDEIYSMMVFPYESVYIGLVQMYHSYADTCYLDIQLAVSRDGSQFTRVSNSGGERTVFIPCGPVGGWDRFNNSLANNAPIVVGDELRFYYGGRLNRHSPYKGPDDGKGAGIGFATVQRDRFVSLDASFDGGVVETIPVTFTGKNLHVNAECAFGEIVVEVLTRNGSEETILARSKPLRANALDIPVEWEEGRLDKVDGPAAVRFTLKNARLYAVWCD